MPSCPAAPHFAKRGDFYCCLPFDEFGWLKHGFSTRDSRPPDDITTLKQVHSAEVRNASGLRDRAAQGDALISNARGTLVGVRTADCVPLLLADHKARAVAAIHAGWRGTAEGIARRAVQRLGEEFGVNPEDVHVAIGPAIRVCCYEVGEDVAARFVPLFPEWNHLEFQGNRRMLDLVEANKRILAMAGVPERQIYDSGLCTFCGADEFYSYRRDPNDPGRMVSFVGRND